MKKQDGGVTIRRGSSDEVDRAGALFAEASAASGFVVGSSASSLARLKKRLSKPTTTILFADHDGETIGVAVVGQAFEDSEFSVPIDGVAHISRVGVKPSHWGRGIGRKLMIEALDEATRSHYRAAQLWVHCGNTRATGLYERFGFADTNDARLDDFGKPMHRYQVALRPTSPN